VVRPEGVERDQQDVLHRHDSSSGRADPRAYVFWRYVLAAPFAAAPDDPILPAATGLPDAVGTPAWGPPVVAVIVDMAPGSRSGMLAGTVSFVSYKLPE
jgi:hypothetical protein